MNILRNIHNCAINIKIIITRSKIKISNGIRSLIDVTIRPIIFDWTGEAITNVKVNTRNLMDYSAVTKLNSGLNKFSFERFTFARINIQRKGTSRKKHTPISQK